jgi:predicted MFS family arabinose efflux permease
MKNSMANVQSAAGRTPPADEVDNGSPLRPFRHSVFAVIWTATVISNVGSWMQTATSGWIMAGLNPDPLIVSLVQAASSLPLFILAIPAGALTDIVDRRRLLIATEIAATILALIFAFLVWWGFVTPMVVLTFTFLISVTSAVTAPAWQSIVPQLVPGEDLPATVALNSVGINISRAVGPALAGAVIQILGIAAPLWLNGLSNFGVIGALFWWRPIRKQERHLPPERLGGAIRVGLRHSRHNRHLRATLIRAGVFFLFASSYWALLPLLAREQIAGGPQTYGLLLAAIGSGAVAGAFALPVMKKKLGPDRLANAGSLGTVLALLLFGLSRAPMTGYAAGIIAGASWIAVLATVNVSTQMALPSWVRGRGLAIFVTVMFGGLTVGSIAWGEVAALIGLPIAHFVAAAGLLLSVPLMSRWKLQTARGLDLTPSMHWPVPVLSHDIEADRGPVLVTVAYHAGTENLDLFLSSMRLLAQQRMRDGAYDWRLFEESARAGHFVETFYLDSWLEHLRQHERVTHADSALQEKIALLQIDGAPKVTHMIAV